MDERGKTLRLELWRVVGEDGTVWQFPAELRARADAWYCLSAGPYPSPRAAVLAWATHLRIPIAEVRGPDEPTTAEAVEAALAAERARVLDAERVRVEGELGAVRIGGSVSERGAADGG